MAGGLLAANRKYFLEIGGYDPGMDIWGGENLEISFRVRSNLLLYITNLLFIKTNFEVWMCGGSIEIIPCSHVGHIFRDGHPYNMTGIIWVNQQKVLLKNNYFKHLISLHNNNFAVGSNGNKDVHGTNSKRLAEVWMDDYKRLFYAHRHDLLDKNVGNLTERITLRKFLKCNNFKWYLNRVIPDKFVPDENVDGYGAVS